MATNTRFETESSHEVAEAWAGQAAEFDLNTHGEYQFVAFYGADQSIVTGQRRVGEIDWTLTTVTEERNNIWDGHNSLVLAVDDDGYLHLVGDLHVDPLNYYRTTDPLDVTTFEQIESMVGSEEDLVTYPRFFEGPDGELVFEYRHKTCSEGDWIYNVYDTESSTWQRLLDDPLIAGGTQSSAYMQGPVVGPNGYYHMAWCWRDTPAAQTNHDLYYAQSKDLIHWENSRGDTVSTPIGFHGAELIDPVPSHGGMINSQIYLSFDSKQRPVVSYFKFDGDGNTQVYNARAESESVVRPVGWEVYETSDWDYRYTFGGCGGLEGKGIGISGLELGADGRLTQTYSHPKYGSGMWMLDEETLEPIEWRSPWNRYPTVAEPADSESHRTVMWAEDSGHSPEGTLYALRWKVDARNSHWADSDWEAPPPSTLELHELSMSS
ncbi:BNR repeat-containing protein [Halocatena marina]|uniref:BNR repeat-containing protein n=1 Tax=Halocatena marina TaxID=2934937 RepID=A0ABD5YX29_9EURY|nr:BNR repeat-containing protein [Halocatena marina]